jgi:2-phosphoglycerate kinase
MSRRLLLVGGSAGTGKSTVAKTVATRIGAAWLQLDTLWIAMRDAAPRGSEEQRRLDIDRRIRAHTEPAEVLLAHHIVASAMVCAALPHALAFELQTHSIVVADGAWLLPEFVLGLELADVDIASVFLHEPDRGVLERAMSSRRDVAMVASWHAESVQVAWLYGNWLADQTRAASLPVVASRPYETAPDRILALAGLPQG